MDLSVVPAQADGVQGWAVPALLSAEKKFRQLKGYREIPNLYLP